MLCLLVPIHPLGGQYTDGYLLSQEVRDDSPGYFGIEKLLLLRVELVLLGMCAHQLLQGFLVDIVIHLAPDHTLIEVKSFNVPPFFHVLLV
jgi:hypothetical protein